MAIHSAGYGDEFVVCLAQRRAGSVGQGFAARTLRRIRQFYVAYPDGSALPPELGGPAKRTVAVSKSQPEKIRTAVLSKSAGVSAPFPPHLGWTHYVVLLELAREREAAERAPRLAASVNGEEKGSESSR